MVSTRASNTRHLVRALQEGSVVGLVGRRYGIGSACNRSIDGSKNRDVGADKSAKENPVATASCMIGGRTFCTSDHGVAVSAVSPHSSHFNDMLINQCIVELVRARSGSRTGNCRIGRNEHSGCVAAYHTDAQSHSTASGGIAGCA
jgi:hypothetical protein